MIYCIEIIKRLLSLCLRQRWEIGFVVGGIDAVMSGKPFDVNWINHNYQDRWFADPWILEVTDKQIILLAEEFRYSKCVGRVARLTISRRDYRLVDMTIVLEKDTHLSFPAILRKEGHIYVYPENGYSGVFTIYEYLDGKLVPVHEYGKMPLADAVMTDMFGKTKLYATHLPLPNGKELYVYEYNEKEQVFERSNVLSFNKEVARMAGDFFKYHGTIYRPAQDCITRYGNAIIIQEMNTMGEVVTDVKRIVSPHYKYKEGCHTLNSYNGITVIDVNGYVHPLLAKSVLWLRELFI